jgi:hypothetical protein
MISAGYGKRQNLSPSVRLDQSPAGLVVRVAGRQSPDAVEVIGQDDHRIDFEWILALDLAEDLP